MTSEKSAMCVELVEKAKRVAQSVWLLEHAKCCASSSSRKGGDNPTCSSRSSSCGLKGCDKACRILAMVDSGKREQSGMVEDAAKLLKHRAECPWATNGGEDTTTCGTTTTASSTPPTPCMICILVARARPTVGTDGMIRLDFSKRQDKGSFKVPPHQQQPEPPVAAVTTKVKKEEKVRPSTTQQELALLLSDMSRTKHDKMSTTKDNGKMGPPAAKKMKNNNPPRASFIKPSSRSFSKAALQNLQQDNAENYKLQQQIRISPPPKITIDTTAYSNNNTNNTTNHLPAAFLSPSPMASAFKQHKKRKWSSMAPSSRALGQWQQFNDNDTVPRSPSFSAAASSLLALTGNKPKYLALVSTLY